MNSDKIANQLSALLVAVIVTVLITVGFAPNTAHGVFRVAGGGSGGGGTVPAATCSTSGGVIYASAGAFTCNANLTTNGAGAISASVSVTSPIYQAAGNLSLRSGAASTDAATVTNNLFTFNSNVNIASNGTNVIALNNTGGPLAGSPSIQVGTGATNNAGWVLGAITNGFSTQWTTGVSPTNANFSLQTQAASAANTYLNAGSGGTGHLTIAANDIATWTVGGFKAQGTNTNDSAAAGIIGEYITSSVSSSGAVVTVSSNVPVTVVSTGATVTAGDWDVEGNVCYISATTTSFTVYKQGINTATNAFGALGTYTTSQFAAMVPLATTTSENCQLTPLTRVSLSGTSNVFMVVAPIFSVSGTITAYGFMRLRRAR